MQLARRHLALSPQATTKTRPKWQSFVSLANLQFTAYGGNPVTSFAANEFDIVLNGGTYYLFGCLHGTNGPTFCYSASALNGTWTLVNSSVFSALYPTVIFDGGTWRAWANTNQTTDPLHYFTASSPGGTWTDQGVAISPPGSGPYSDMIFDPCVRKMPDTTYIMTGGSYYLSKADGNIGYFTSPSGNNGTWTYQIFPIVPTSLISEGPRRSDFAPFVSSGNEFVATYTAYQSSSATVLGGGMMIFDANLGGWVMRETPLIAGAAIGNPVLYEFSAGVYTLVWCDSGTGKLCYATSAAGAVPWVQRNWIGTVEP